MKYQHTTIWMNCENRILSEEACHKRLHVVKVQLTERSSTTKPTGREGRQHLPTLGSHHLMGARNFWKQRGDGYPTLWIY